MRREGKPLRIRPFFWFLLAVSCLGILLFAAIRPVRVPAVMQVHVTPQPPASAGLTTVQLHLMDMQGLPIEEAHILSSAHMTNMQMGVQQQSVRSLGHGTYTVQLHLYMAGPWSIIVQAQADGFDALLQTLQVGVQ